ncbi:MAG: MalY/PatB family protein [Planctomycetia bacterium]|nr:MalY/PatB family protein [Planctomycetia bacterium]
MSAFDKVIDRQNRKSIKYDFFDHYGKPCDAIPLWVADMDFASPPAVLDAVRAMADYGVLGYSWSSPKSLEAVVNWFEMIHHWSTRPEWIVQTPGVMFAVATIIQATTCVNESVLIQEPVYYPFREAVEKNNRRLVVHELSYVDGRYEIDFDAFESLIIKNNVRLFLLCSPHNPVGRVWSEEELTRLAEVCRKWNVLVVSDEIHADLVYSGHKHTVFASLPDELGRNAIVCTSPSKTFNLSGLHTGNMIVPRDDLRSRITSVNERLFYYGTSLPAIVATEAAYTQGEDWYRELLSYLEGNRDYLVGAFRKMNAGIRPVALEGTYLLWLDCREMKLSDDKLESFWTQDARLWLHRGTTFGQSGTGFMRMNIASPRKILEEAVRRVEVALAKKS